MSEYAIKKQEAIDRLKLEIAVKTSAIKQIESALEAIVMTTQGEIYNAESELKMLRNTGDSVTNLFLKW